ncbi:outer membrane lipoprotein-sorting protein [Hydrocarboniphaga sp.]|uniref:outer membrane lipoprotein-sorting protein n=1 Tax=Hydrocarboniphaga sp. TaxID=2033016 RepID=UPI003D0F4651
MSRNHLGRCAALLCCALLCGAPVARAADAKDAEQVLSCMRANSSSALRTQKITMDVRERGIPVRSLAGWLYTMRDHAGLLRVNLRITEPEALAGGAYLINQTADAPRGGMYVYLPSVGRVRKLSGSVADGALMGTQFSYVEFKQLQSAFGDLHATLETPEDIEGRRVEVLSFRGFDSSQSRYSGARAWIDQQSCVPLKADFMAGTKVLKRMIAPASSIRRDGAVYYVQQLQMRDLENDALTELRSEKGSTRSTAAKLFDPETFYTAN